MSAHDTETLRERAWLDLKQLRWHERARLMANPMNAELWVEQRVSDALAARLAEQSARETTLREAVIEAVELAEQCWHDSTSFDPDTLYGTTDRLRALAAASSSPAAVSGETEATT